MMIHTSHDDALPDLSPPRNWPPHPDATPLDDLNAILGWARRRASTTTSAWLEPAAERVIAALSNSKAHDAEVAAAAILYAAMLAPETEEGATQWAWLRENAAAIVEHMKNPGQPWPLPTAHADESNPR